MSVVTFEDRIARIAKKNGTPMVPSTAGGVPMAYSPTATQARDVTEQSSELRANLNRAGRSVRVISLVLAMLLGSISGVMFQQFVGFDLFLSLPFADHIQQALQNPTYLFAWLAILLGPVMFSLLAIVRTDAMRLTQFAGIYFGTSFGINLAMAIQNIAA